MKKILISALLLNLAIITAFTLNSDISFRLGTKTCVAKYKENKAGIATLLSLHDNENTAIDAFNDLPNDTSFNLFEIHQNNVRVLTCNVNNKNYDFDPNRIFSDIGIDSTLKKYNSGVTKFPAAVIKQIKTFSADLLKAYVARNQNTYIISIHNNTNEGALSLTDYIKPNKYHQEAKAFFKAEGKDLDDFFLVTTLNDFNYLKGLNENVVLQSDNPTDDGSLSVYCAKNKIPYINIEAENGHKAEQLAMLKAVYSLLKIR
ncbi:hypothetical protein G7074_17780 [Pedobacter sp. HDW13]|uniref:hypothetical protein n=1 Tax=unclassified Pedobacter TaxID=2628915 RepID=UPI000F59758F|nr:MULTISPECIES: hypothetical protein [unclassified Pedobacter]QIL40952.1 hypothetical protein G7074_17780 [Pedobacter sp. HDW13]RQO64996.1 hypothetical protein DBR40_24275 [Pedobacter sp. KBW01]